MLAATSPSRNDLTGLRFSLRREMQAKAGHNLWLFVARPELTVENLLHGEVFYEVAQGPKHLIRPPAGHPAPEKGAEKAPEGTNVRK